MAFELITVGKGSMDGLVVVKRDDFYIRVADRQAVNRANVSVDKDNKLFKIEFTPSGQRACTRVGINKYKVSCRVAANLVREWWGGDRGKNIVLDAELDDETTIIIKGVLKD